MTICSAIRSEDSRSLCQRPRAFSCDSKGHQELSEPLTTAQRGAPSAPACGTDLPLTSLGLALKASQALRVVGERVGKELQRDVAVQLGIARTVDLPHPAFADESGDLVRAEANAR